MTDIVRDMWPLFAITAIVFLVPVVWCVRERRLLPATIYFLLTLLNVFWLIVAFAGALPN